MAPPTTARTGPARLVNAHLALHRAPRRQARPRSAAAAAAPGARAAPRTAAAAARGAGPGDLQQRVAHGDGVAGDVSLRMAGRGRRASVVSLQPARAARFVAPAPTASSISPALAHPAAGRAAPHLPRRASLRSAAAARGPRAARSAAPHLRSAPGAGRPGTAARCKRRRRWGRERTRGALLREVRRLRQAAAGDVHEPGRRSTQPWPTGRALRRAKATTAARPRGSLHMRAPHPLLVKRCASLRVPWPDLCSRRFRYATTSPASTSTSAHPSLSSCCCCAARCSEACCSCAIAARGCDRAGAEEERCRGAGRSSALFCCCRGRRSGTAARGTGNPYVFHKSCASSSGLSTSAGIASSALGGRSQPAAHSWTAPRPTWSDQCPCYDPHLPD